MLSRKMTKDLSIGFGVPFWHITIFGCIAIIDRNRGTAEMAGPFAGSPLW